MKYGFCITLPKEFPACHASSICEAPNGDLLACCYAGQQEGAPDQVILGARFDHESSKWLETKVWVDVAHRAAGNPRVFLGPEKDVVWLIAPINYGAAWCSGGTRLFMKRSYDNGHTWTDLELLIDEKGILGKNKPLIHDSLCLLPVEKEDIWSAAFLRSEDGGETWKLTGDLGKDAGAHLIQPAVVMLANGTLMAYMRSQENFIFRSYSYDKGKTWSKSEATPLPNNNSGIDMVRLASGNLALVYNPTKLDSSHNKLAPSWPTVMPVGFEAWGARTPLEITLSPDEGKNWPYTVTLEDSPGVFSYPAIIQSRDGMIHVTYTYQREAIRHVQMTEEEIIKA